MLKNCRQKCCFITKNIKHLKLKLGYMLEVAPKCFIEKY